MHLRDTRHKASIYSAYKSNVFEIQMRKEK